MHYWIQPWIRWLLESCGTQNSSQFPLMLAGVGPFFYSTSSKLKNHFQLIYFYLPLRVIQKYLLILRIAFTAGSVKLFFPVSLSRSLLLSSGGPLWSPVLHALIHMSCKANSPSHDAQQMALAKSSAKSSVLLISPNSQLPITWLHCHDFTTLDTPSFHLFNLPRFPSIPPISTSRVLFHSFEGLAGPNTFGTSGFKTAISASSGVCFGIKSSPLFLPLREKQQ